MEALDLGGLQGWGRPAVRASSQGQQSASPSRALDIASQGAVSRTPPGGTQPLHPRRQAVSRPPQSHAPTRGTQRLSGHCVCPARVSRRGNRGTQWLSNPSTLDPLEARTHCLSENCPKRTRRARIRHGPLWFLYTVRNKRHNCKHFYSLSCTFGSKRRNSCLLLSNASTLATNSTRNCTRISRRPTLRRAAQPAQTRGRHGGA